MAMAQTPRELANGPVDEPPLAEKL